MHYKNGREAKNGDIIVALYGNGSYYVGALFNAKAPNGSDCNGSLAPITLHNAPVYADLKNCLHIDDIAAATVPDLTKTAEIPLESVADQIGDTQVKSTSV